MFIEEWLDTKKAEYKEIERLAGSGDQGVDVAAHVSTKTERNYIWDCYQCKHYDNPLYPTNIWIELGKIIYYSYKKEYPVPRSYYFVAPKGCGTTVSKLLKDAEKLKAALKTAWQDYCAGSLIAGVNLPLSGDLAAYFESFDFTIFKKISPKLIIEEHKKHPNHITWFGGGLPERAVLTETDIPVTIQPHESKYVSQLLLAYNSDSSVQFPNPPELIAPYENHFKRARLNFHYAEQLRNLYRDSLPNGTFERFQDEIYDGIVNIYENVHKNGFHKMKAVETQATVINISSNPLKDVSVQKDKIGVCHQLCNEAKLIWIP